MAYLSLERLLMKTDSLNSTSLVTSVIAVHTKISDGYNYTLFLVFLLFGKYNELGQYVLLNGVFNSFQMPDSRPHSQTFKNQKTCAT